MSSTTSTNTTTTTLPTPQVAQIKLARFFERAAKISTHIQNKLEQDPEFIQRRLRMCHLRAVKRAEAMKEKHEECRRHCRRQTAQPEESNEEHPSGPERCDRKRYLIVRLERRHRCHSAPTAEQPAAEQASVETATPSTEETTAHDVTMTPVDAAQLLRDEVDTRVAETTQLQEQLKAVQEKRKAVMEKTRAEIQATRELEATLRSNLKGVRSAVSATATKEEKIAARESATAERQAIQEHLAVVKAKREALVAALAPIKSDKKKNPETSRAEEPSNPVKVEAVSAEAEETPEEIPAPVTLAQLKESLEKIRQSIKAQPNPKARQAALKATEAERASIRAQIQHKRKEKGKTPKTE